ncbi:MAG TPA: hypothetical protein DDY91_05780 [Planctomycetaceae bacterium]|nr:hypothetical protein [Planctomycetaceae bacterium]
MGCIFRLATEAPPRISLIAGITNGTIHWGSLNDPLVLEQRLLASTRVSQYHQALTHSGLPMHGTSRGSCV